MKKVQRFGVWHLLEPELDKGSVRGSGKIA
jgi:hypothetical protein